MTTTEHADQPADAPDTAPAKGGLVFPGMALLFVVLICCFTAWGVAADLTTPMVAGFKRIFEMSTFQASLVQLAYYGAYFLLALPAAFLNQRFGYKAGRHPDGFGPGCRRSVRVLPGEQDHDVRRLPGGTLRNGSRVLDPGDVGEPLRHLLGPGSHRDPETQPGPGFQPGGNQHRG